MTTKGNCFPPKNKQFSLGEHNLHSEHVNINLNQNGKHPLLIPVQFQSKSYYSGTSETNDYNYGRKTQSWEKPFSSKFCSTAPDSLVFQNEKTRKCWKKKDGFSHTSNSTLSLLILAYENSTEVGGSSDLFCNKSGDYLKKDNLKQQILTEKMLIQNPFEFPRQQENQQPVEPAIVPFRAQQRLLNPNGRGRYKHYTPQEKTDCVIWYIRSGRTADVQRSFHTKYGRNEQAPSRGNILRWFDDFEQRGSVFRKERVSERPVRSDENIQEVLEFFSAFQHSTLRRAENELGISKTSVQRILKEAKWHPYVIQLVQDLEPNDLLLRVAFAEQHLDFLAAQPDHLERIWWSDEANFNVNGAVNKHNCRYWSPTNPQFHAAVPLHSPKVSVWAAISANGIVGPYFFPGNVGGESYVHMLQEFYLPEMENRPYFDTMLFQQDGAPAHFANITKDLLNEVFPERWIGRGSPNLVMPPRSPDLTVMDFFLWGYIKSKVYSVEIRDLDHLMERIIDAFVDLSPEMVRRACLQGVERRLRKCLEVGGRSVELPDVPRQAEPEAAPAPAPQNIPLNPRRRRQHSPLENVEPPVARRRGRPRNPSPPAPNAPLPEAEHQANVAHDIPSQDSEAAELEPTVAADPPRRINCSIN